MIECRKCRNEFSEDGFYKKPDGSLRHPCKACTKKRSDEYYKNHLAQYREAQNKWDRDNRESRREISRKYYQGHKAEELKRHREYMRRSAKAREKRAEHNAIYRAKNSEKIKTTFRRYYEQHPEKFGNNHRRARTRGVPYEAVNKYRVFERDNYVCQICHEKTRSDLIGSSNPLAPELDHEIPLAIPNGPGHTYANCQCAHRKCNRSKSDKIIAGRQFPLFAKHIA